jgi:hypothetical protein
VEEGEKSWMEFKKNNSVFKAFASVTSPQSELYKIDDKNLENN